MNILWCASTNFSYLARDCGKEARSCSNPTDRKEASTALVSTARSFRCRGPSCVVIKQKRAANFSDSMMEDEVKSVAITDFVCVMSLGTTEYTFFCCQIFSFDEPQENLETLGAYCKQYDDTLRLQVSRCLIGSLHFFFHSQEPRREGGEATEGKRESQGDADRPVSALPCPVGASSAVSGHRSLTPLLRTGCEDKSKGTSRR